MHNDIAQSEIKHLTDWHAMQLHGEVVSPVASYRAQRDNSQWFTTENQKDVSKGISTTKCDHRSVRGASGTRGA